MWSYMEDVDRMFDEGRSRPLLHHIRSSDIILSQESSLSRDGSFPTAMTSASSGIVVPIQAFSPQSSVSFDTDSSEGKYAVCAKPLEYPPYLETISGKSSKSSGSASYSEDISNEWQSVNSSGNGQTTNGNANRNDSLDFPAPLFFDDPSIWSTSNLTSNDDSDGLEVLHSETWSLQCERKLKEEMSNNLEMSQMSADIKRRASAMAKKVSSPFLQKKQNKFQSSSRWNSFKSHLPSKNLASPAFNSKKWAFSPASGLTEPLSIDASHNSQPYSPKNISFQRCGALSKVSLFKKKDKGMQVTQAEQLHKPKKFFEEEYIPRSMMSLSNEGDERASDDQQEKNDVAEHAAPQRDETLSNLVVETAASNGVDSSDSGIEVSVQKTRKSFNEKVVTTMPISPMKLIEKALEKFSPTWEREEKWSPISLDVSEERQPVKNVTQSTEDTMFQNGKRQSNLRESEITKNEPTQMLNKDIVERLAVLGRNINATPIEERVTAEIENQLALLERTFNIPPNDDSEMFRENLADSNSRVTRAGGSSARKLQLRSNNIGTSALNNLCGLRKGKKTRPNLDVLATAEPPKRNNPTENQNIKTQNRKIQNIKTQESRTGAIQGRVTILEASSPPAKAPVKVIGAVQGKETILQPSSPPAKAPLKVLGAVQGRETILQPSSPPAKAPVKVLGAVQRRATSLQPSLPKAKAPVKVLRDKKVANLKKGDGVVSMPEPASKLDKGKSMKSKRSRIFPKRSNSSLNLLPVSLLEPKSQKKKVTFNESIEFFAFSRKSSDEHSIHKKASKSQDEDKKSNDRQKIKTKKTDKPVLYDDEGNVVDPEKYLRELDEPKKETGLSRKASKSRVSKFSGKVNHCEDNVSTKGKPTMNFRKLSGAITPRAIVKLGMENRHPSHNKKEEKRIIEKVKRKNTKLDYGSSDEETEVESDLDDEDSFCSDMKQDARKRNGQTNRTNDLLRKLRELDAQEKTRQSRKTKRLMETLIVLDAVERKLEDRRRERRCYQDSCKIVAPGMNTPVLGVGCCAI